VRNDNSSKRRNRHGTTLLELLLVLGLLVIIAGLAWPSLNRAFDGRRLQLAGEQLRADIAATRMKAINTGRAFVLRYQPQTSVYTIEPYDDGWTESNTSNGSTYDEPYDPSRRPADLMLVQRQLPEDVTFLAGQNVIDTRQEEILTDLEQTGGSGRRRAGEPETEMFFCYPDGSTATARIYLANKRDRCIAVQVRGLTGVASLSEPMSVVEIPQ
jgi:type II secretory pathway pseudopilin PulG